jgi:hypothetical protein
MSERRRHLDRKRNPFLSTPRRRTDRELDHIARELKPVLDEDFARVAETAGREVAGVSLSLPD